MVSAIRPGTLTKAGLGWDVTPMAIMGECACMCGYACVCACVCVCVCVCKGGVHVCAGVHVCMCVQVCAQVCVGGCIKDISLLII